MSASMIMDTGQSASVPVPLADDFWEGIKRTLTGDGIDDEKADLIVALLTKSYEKRIINTQDEIIGVTDQLKLISIDNISKLNEQLEIIASRLEIPIIGISLTEQKVKKWRIIITYLFGAGVSIAAINAIVPIPFGLIANSVFAGGVQAARVFFSSFAGTGTNMTPEAIQNATAAAAAAPRSMVAGPSMDAVKALGGIIGETLGSVIYTLSALALTKCVDVASTVVSAASTAVSGACHLLSQENANKIADLAVLSATVKGITVGIDNGWDFVRHLNNGDYDAAIAEIIDKGPVDSATNAIINNIIESVYNIEASKIGIEMDTGIPDRDLEPSAKQMIKSHFDQALEDAEVNIPNKNGLNKINKRISSMLSLSALDDEVPNPVVVKQLIQEYGMAVVILYMIWVNKSPEATPGFGQNEKSSSQPDADMYSSEKWVKMPPSSASMFASRKEPIGPNPFRVQYETKTSAQILKEAGYYPDSESIFQGYIQDFIGGMNPIVLRVLSEPMDLGDLSLGNLYTAIAKNNLTPDEQKAIVSFIMKKVRANITGWDDTRGERIVDELAVGVRKMILRDPVVAAAETVFSESLFKKVTGVTGFRGTPKLSTHEAEYTGADFIGLAEKKEQEQQQQKVLERKKAADAAAAELGKRKRLGGSRRKSRRHKKKRSTLKRRRMKRRRTRKGKKRRHTRKH